MKAVFTLVSTPKRKKKRKNLIRHKQKNKEEKTFRGQRENEINRRSDERRGKKTVYEKSRSRRAGVETIELKIG